MEGKKYNLFLSSKDKSSGSNNDFTIQFNNSQNLFNKARLFVKPVECVLPFDFPTIDSTNNQVRIIRTDASIDTVITLDQGSPSASALAEHLEGKIQLALNSTNISVDFDNYSKKFFLINNAVQSLNLTLDFDVPNSLHKVMGAEKTQYVMSAISYTFPNSPDFTGIEDVLVYTNVAKRGLEMRNNLLQLSPVLFAFNLGNANVGDNIVWQNPSDLYYQEIDNNFSSISVAFKDKSGRLIPFTGDAYLNLELTLFKDEKVNAAQNINMSR